MVYHWHILFLLGGDILSESAGSLSAVEPINFLDFVAKFYNESIENRNFYRPVGYSFDNITGN